MMVEGSTVQINADMLTRIKSAYVLIVVQDFIVIQRSLPMVAENTAHNTVQTEVEKREFRRYVLVVTIHLV